MKRQLSQSLLRSPNIVQSICLTLVLPGLGLWCRGYQGLAIRILGTGAGLTLSAWMVASLWGMGAGIFFGFLFILPWWCLHIYETSLPHPQGQFAALKVVWAKGHDIRYLGGLFLLTAVTDLAIIVFNPDYQLTVFCHKPQGMWGFLAKAQSPILHIAIGYGFLRLLPWSFLLYMGYACFGLLNALANYSCFGYGRIRTVFVISLLAFSAYVICRKACFNPTFSPEPLFPKTQ